MTVEMPELGERAHFAADDIEQSIVSRFESRVALVSDRPALSDRGVILSSFIEDVPPYAVVGGHPVKVIRYRPSEETIEAYSDLPGCYAFRRTFNHRQV